MGPRSEYEYRINNLIKSSKQRIVASNKPKEKNVKTVKLEPVRREHYYCPNCGANTATVKDK